MTHLHVVGHGDLGRLNGKRRDETGLVTGTGLGARKLHYGILNGIVG